MEEVRCSVCHVTYEVAKRDRHISRFMYLCPVCTWKKQHPSIAGDARNRIPRWMKEEYKITEEML
jgi:rubredoxin